MEQAVLVVVMVLVVVVVLDSGWWLLFLDVPDFVGQDFHNFNWCTR